MTSESSVSPQTQESPPPAWFAQLQEEAAKQYGQLSWPKKKDENWRFGVLRGAEVEEYQAAPAPSTADELVSRSAKLSNSIGQIVFANERLVHANLPKHGGLICCPLRVALERHAALLQEHFMTQDARLGSAKLAALHKSQTKSGVFLYVPNGLSLDGPIEVHHWLEGEKIRAFPHTLIVTGNQAKVSLVDHYRSADERAGFCCAVGDLVAGCGSEILYAANQRLNRASLNLQVLNTLANADARIQSLLVQIGSAWTRSEAVTHLLGKGADSQMLSASLASGEQEIDQRTWQHHAEPRTTSDLLYKYALYGKARTVFAGLIRVDDAAHFTDAYQTCRNLLMSEEAEANAMPGLEINADRVKCSHGSTSSQIDPEQLFFCNARGISTPAAKQLIATGFLNEPIDRFRDESIREMLKERLAEGFARLA